MESDHRFTCRVRFGDRRILRYFCKNINSLHAIRTTFYCSFLTDSDWGQGIDFDQTVQGGLENQGLSVLNLSEIATGPTHYFHKLNMMLNSVLNASSLVIGLYTGNDFSGISDKNIDRLLSHSYEKNPLRYAAIDFLMIKRIRYRIDDKKSDLLYMMNSYRNSSMEEIILPHSFEKNRKFYPDWIQYFTSDNYEAMAIMRGDKRQADVDTNFADFFKKMEMNDGSILKVSSLINVSAQRFEGKTILVLIPCKEYYSESDHAEYDRLIDNFKKRISEKVSIADLHHHLAAENYFPIDGHWNESGHRLASAVISAALLEQVDQALIPISNQQ